jgi:hypothetical protein
LDRRGFGNSQSTNIRSINRSDIQTHTKSVVFASIGPKIPTIRPPRIPENRCRPGLCTIRKPTGPPTRATIPHTSACRTAPNTYWRFSPSITASRRNSSRLFRNGLPRNSPEPRQGRSGAGQRPNLDRLPGHQNNCRRPISLRVAHMTPNKELPSPHRAEIRSIPGSPWRWAFVYYSLWQGVAL